MYIETLEMWLTLFPNVRTKINSAVLLLWCMGVFFFPDQPLTRLYWTFMMANLLTMYLVICHVFCDISKEAVEASIYSSAISIPEEEAPFFLFSFFLFFRSSHKGQLGWWSYWMNWEKTGIEQWIEWEEASCVTIAVVSVSKCQQSATV